MKKWFLYGSFIFFLFLVSCKPTGNTDPVPPDTKDSTPPLAASINWGALKQIEEKMVREMALLYFKAGSAKPELLIRQINMDVPVFMGILKGQKRLKLICALAAGSDKPTVILQREESDTYVYYDIHELFNSSQTGMDGQEPVCPIDGPIQDPLKAGEPGLLMEDDQVREMAELYITRVKEDPAIFLIQQIYIDAYAAQAEYAGRKGLKMVMAAAAGDTTSTVLMQTWTGTGYFYADIRNLFVKGMAGIGESPLSLCPPPDHCDLP